MIDDHAMKANVTSNTQSGGVLLIGLRRCLFYSQKRILSAGKKAQFSVPCFNIVQVANDTSCHGGISELRSRQNLVRNGSFAGLSLMRITFLQS